MSESLQKLKRGETTLDEYLDERVELALAHVKGKVPDETLELMRGTMREKVRTDPGLVEMVRRLTGEEPRPLGSNGKQS